MRIFTQIMKAIQICFGAIAVFILGFRYLLSLPQSWFDPKSHPHAIFPIGEMGMIIPAILAGLLLTSSIYLCSRRIWAYISCLIAHSLVFYISATMVYDAIKMLHSGSLLSPFLLLFGVPLAFISATFIAWLAIFRRRILYEPAA